MRGKKRYERIVSRRGGLHGKYEEISDTQRQGRKADILSRSRWRRRDGGDMGRRGKEWYYSASVFVRPSLFATGVVIAVSGGVSGTGGLVKRVSVVRMIAIRMSLPVLHDFIFTHRWFYGGGVVAVIDGGVGGDADVCVMIFFSALASRVSG